MASAGGGNIKVVVRVRPFNGRELDRQAKCIVSMREGQTILTPPETDGGQRGTSKGPHKGEGQKVFAFDKSYWSFAKHDPHFAGQDDLFNDLGRPLLENAFEGYNNCIFAYGQTGSGKSFSMMGYGGEVGIIPRICKEMFSRIDELQEDNSFSCTVEVSYLEIYNERVRDLLNPTTKGNLKVREHPLLGPYVEDLAKLVVRSFQEIENLMDEGNKARTVAATNMNETSSRSHAVFTLTLTQRRHDQETSMDSERVAKISLVDLAGSERALSTGATGARLKEGAEINKSLSTLGRVIAALADLSVGKKKNLSMVPYRDSVLTWLLKDSLGGNSMTAMIAAISPASLNYEETLSTLRYADSAKRIKNHAIVNEDPNARMIRELKEELAQLRAKLVGKSSSIAAGVTKKDHAPGTPLEEQIVSITQSDGTVTEVSKAEIAEQLNQSEKLYQDLNQTWEQKLQKTEQIHKEREAALEELGISIEKGFVGLSTPKKVPHLVNLSDDPLLAECLIYNIKPGSTTVGNVDTATTSEIRLNGSKILQNHCKFENEDGVVTLIPSEGAVVMVNGLRIDSPKRLRSGFRIIFGDFHIFRFNHPLEARAERAEHSLLRHSVTATTVGSPNLRPRGHERTYSTADSETEGEHSRPESPARPARNGRDSDWSFARREAAHAIFGPDQRISTLTDDELDNLYEDIQKARAVRKGQPESRLDLEDDMDSVTSFPIREKYASIATTEDFSLDTAITQPSTPPAGDISHDNDGVLEGSQSVMVVDEANEEINNVRYNMEDQLRKQKEGLQRQLETQKQVYETQLVQIQRPVDGFASQPGALREPDISIAKRAIERWRRLKYVAMVEAILQHASMLTEAQVMSREMDKAVSFQFAVVDHGYTQASSYDMVLSDISGEVDEALNTASKPCIGVRVVDFRHCVIYIWSITKLQSRLRLMRQVHQYLDRPDYLQHFSLENPFSESCLPQYSLIGDADVPLTAVFEARVQDFAAEITSPYTSAIVGVLHLSLEPSSSQTPGPMIRFSVVMHELVGFAEREGTEVHAQLSIPGISADEGATTTPAESGFEEGPIRFESVHSLSLPQDSLRTSTLRIAIFARVTTMHLDKILSWDDMRDGVQQPQGRRKHVRLAESEYFSEERHDFFARIQILELSESGQYLPVNVLQSSATDLAYQLHQGVQRRIVINITHSSGDVLQWQRIMSFNVGNVQLVDPSGKVPSLTSQSSEIPVKLVSPSTVKHNANGTSNVTFIGQWDSSLHNSLLLDRITSERYRIQMCISWEVASPQLKDPIRFSIKVHSQVQPRSSNRYPSKFMQLWNSTRIVRSTVGIFALSIRPMSAKRAVDLWRMNTRHDYVKGEENLAGWSPRGVSLVRDHVRARKRKRRVAEIASARGVLSSHPLASAHLDAENGESELEQSERQQRLVQKFLDLWTAKHDSDEIILSSKNIEPPQNGAAFAPSNDGAGPPRMIAEVQHVTKNPSVLRCGYLLAPDDSNSFWVKRYVELRRPYIHLYAVPEADEVDAINLRNSRIEHQPQIARLLQRPNVFAVYAVQNTYLFAARNERDKLEWILKIDQSYFSSGSNSGEEL
ncbi:MAG: kinesin-like protein Klp8 [Candelina mexicana]|nr:MAG: kinesin-like protein Klp8 [Candelina mexicana]